jgi:hypothetical protein
MRPLDRARDWQLLAGLAGVLEFVECLLLSSLDPERPRSLIESSDAMLGFAVGLSLWVATWLFPQATNWRWRTGAALVGSVTLPMMIFTLDFYT